MLMPFLLALPADLDHTADVQLHACAPPGPPCCFKTGWLGGWLALLRAGRPLEHRPPQLTPLCPAPGANPAPRPAGGATLEEAIANCGLAMFNYMTPLEGIATDPALTRCAAAGPC